MKRLYPLLFCTLAAAFIISISGCAKKDLTPPIFKHHAWKHMVVTTTSRIDSNGRYAGPKYDTTIGYPQAALVRVDESQVKFNDMIYWLETNNDTILEFTRTVYDSDEPSGTITFYKAADSIYAYLYHYRTSYPANPAADGFIEEYWWSAD